jgi:hypothetical protein
MIIDDSAAKGGGWQLPSTSLGGGSLPILTFQIAPFTCQFSCIFTLTVTIQVFNSFTDGGYLLCILI